jgi:hypothetical protein
MLGIEDYASDSDAEPKEPLNHSSKTKRAPKKFTIALPSLPVTDSAENSEDEERPAKKRRTGAGTSSLLSMLPMPKQNSVNQSQVGIGGTKTEILDHKLGTQVSKDQDSPLPLSLKPSSLGKGKRNISVEEVNIRQAAQSRHSPATDFFALGEHFQPFKYEMGFNVQQVMPKKLQRALMSRPRPLFFLQLLPCPRLSLLNLLKQILIQVITSCHQVFGLLMTPNIMPNS